MCGEHGRLATMPCRSPGSSPHVRGAQRLERQSCSLSGIIPACAGSTPTATRPSREPRDHPRMCGEHFTTTGSPYCSSGSSPHVRGAPTGDLLGVTIGGIIPACAGSTPTATRPSREPRDHPRMCGEHLPDVSLAVPLPGSSPHVRGALARRFASGSATGIIPACAGSTPMSPTGRGAMWDHPRMCGEHSRPMKSRSNCGGSSPHVRGARQSRSLINLSLGIIPACAGSTSETALHPW